jgi:hypothetical protein
MFYVQGVLIVVALALKKMKMSLSVLIVAWGSIRKVGIRSTVNSCLSNELKKMETLNIVRI